MKNIHMFYQHMCTHAPHAHAQAHTLVCSQSELLTFSSRLIAIDICLLSWACSRVGADGNGWCYCWRRKREGRKQEVVGGVWKEEDQGRQAPHAAPGIHLDPLLTRKVTGRLNLTSSLQKSRRCDRRLWASIWLYCSATQPVIYPHCPQSSWKRRTGGSIRSSSWKILIDA